MHPYPKHLAGFSYLGPYRYFLTFCTFARARHFVDRDSVALVESHLLRTCDTCQFADLAHCFMPDHLHVAVEGLAPASDLRLLIRSFKQFSGFYFQQAKQCRLWQRYGYEHVIRADASTLEVVRYVLANPLRAGLARRVSEYPFIGSGRYSIAELVECCSSA